jgi:hypothetical protein
MIRLDHISAGLALTGIEPSVVATVVSVIRIAEQEAPKRSMEEKSREFVEKDTEVYDK